MAGAIQIYVESTAKRAFAGAIEWPGWCRAGRRPDDAIAKLLEYGPRYAAVLSGVVRGFKAPRSDPDLVVDERLTGDATTDFGAPSIAPAADRRALDVRELSRLLSILETSWTAFDRVADAAADRQLRKGPRGGGRELDAIVAHVIGAEGSYIAKLAAPRPKTEGSDLRVAAQEERDAVRAGLSKAVTDGLPDSGPRGGSIWLPRYFVRRAAWHVLDHAWEIEDRADLER
jgi:hypothetical protein